MLIGIDTSVVVGLSDSRDHWHPAATSLQEALTAAGLEPVYFDCTLAEAVRTLTRRLRGKRREGERPQPFAHLSTTFPGEVSTLIPPGVPPRITRRMDWR